MIADHLGFCRECHGILENGTDENGEPILLFREGKAYIDLSIQHTLSSPDTAYRIVHKAYDKILVDLAVDEYIHIVELRRKKKTKAEIVYEYCADHNNDWGEIYYTFGDDDYDVTRYVYADKKRWILLCRRRRVDRPASCKRAVPADDGHTDNETIAHKTQKAPPGAKKNS